MENVNKTKQELLAKIEELELRLKAMEVNTKEVHDMNEVLVEYFKKLERRYERSVKRELSYREMLFIFNHREANDMIMDFISERGLKVQYAGNHTFRCN
jgi:predicted nuclease with TOPRIM domain